MVSSGELDEMNEFQLMIVLQKVNRAATSQRNLSYAERLQILGDFGGYLH